MNILGANVNILGAIMYI